MVQLPQRRVTWYAAQCIQHRDRSTLHRAIVHHRDPWRNRAHQRRARALVPPVVRHHQQVHVAQPVHRALQLLLLVARQVAQVEHPCVAPLEREPQRTRVFCGIRLPLPCVGAERIRAAPARQRLCQHLSIGTYSRRREAGHRQPLARVHHVVPVLPARYQLLVRRARRACRATKRFAILTVVQKHPDRHPRHQRRHAAHMVQVVVRNQHGIEPADPGHLHRGLNAPRVPPTMIIPACIHQQRVLVRCHKQCRLPAFHVDEKHLQRSRGRGWRRRAGALPASSDSHRQHRHEQPDAPYRCRCCAHGGSACA